MSGRNSFSRLREQIDAAPECRRRMGELGNAYDALLDLADSDGSNEEVARIIECRAQDVTAEDLREFARSGG